MSLPSQQLGAKKVNGNSLLVGYNANEGPLFVPPTIITESDLIVWLSIEFPNLSDEQINSILVQNPNNANTNHDTPRFETDGLHSPNAVNMLQAANGQQQRGNNIYAEATFVCPSYWMASAYSNKKSWQYQYSVPFAFHTTDVTAYFGPPTPNQSNDFVLAFRRIWGNFVANGNPSISDQIGNGASAPDPNVSNFASYWPQWTDASPMQLNLNETGGTPYSFTTQWGSNVTQFMQPGLLNAIAIVPADSWEGNRGDRCNFYRNLAPSIPA
jgi:carboxylesterase type B